MSWTSIITALALASLSAYLVIFQGWDFWVASLVAAGGMIMIILTIFTGMLLAIPPEQRASELSEFKQGFLEVINDMLNKLRK